MQVAAAAATGATRSEVLGTAMGSVGKGTAGALAQTMALEVVVLAVLAPTRAVERPRAAAPAYACWNGPAQPAQVVLAVTAAMPAAAAVVAKEASAVAAAVPAAAAVAVDLAMMALMVRRIQAAAAAGQTTRTGAMVGADW